jgi:hypothetical protein
MKMAILCSISISEYDEMTPYELNLCIEAFTERMEAESQEKIILTWLGEHYHRLKKLPSMKKALEQFFGKHEKYMTDEEMLLVAKKLNAQFGGLFEEGETIDREKHETDSLQGGSEGH